MRRPAPSAALEVVVTIEDQLQMYRELLKTKGCVIDPSWKVWSASS
jgi:hypothetical protein